MTIRKSNPTLPDASLSESLNDPAKADDTAVAMPAAQTPPRPARRPKEKPATMKGATALATLNDHTPDGADPATGTAVANTLPGSKLDRLLSLLRQPDGATITKLAAATGWQVHSVRGALAGALRKKGHTVVSEKKDGGERRYRIGDAS
jgi:Protein of unknown function (DUF3489)